MSKFIKIVITCFLIAFLYVPVSASNYVNPPSYETPVNSNDSPSRQNESPNTSDDSTIFLAFGIFAVAIASIFYLRHNKAK